MKRKMITAMIVFIVAVLFLNNAYAAPSISSISGSIISGESITISGSDFGAKDNPGPLLWDNFDNGISGGVVCSISSGTEPIIHQGNLNTYTRWIMDGGGAYSSKSITFNNSTPLRKNSLHARAYIDSRDCWGCNFYVPVGWYNATGKELYVSFYLRTIPNGIPRQSKAFIGYDSSWADTLYFSTAYGSSCEPSTQWRQHITSPASERYFATTGQGVVGEWIRVENYLQQSGAGVANGKFYSYLHRPTISSPSIGSIERNSVTLRSSATNTTRITLGGAYYDMCNGTQPVHIDVDEVYVDSTPARVEIGNASTWTSCTLRELQLPTAWSASSVTIRVNQDKFPVGTTAYLYIVNTDGNVNLSGYPITIGSGGESSNDTTPPAPPTIESIIVVP